MSVPPNGVAATLQDHERRLDHIEAHEPAVLAERVRLLAGEMRALKRALWAFVFSMLLVALSIGATALLHSGQG